MKIFAPVDARRQDWPRLAAQEINRGKKDITALDGRLTTAEGDIGAVESDVGTLQGQMTTAQNDITALQSGKVDKGAGTSWGAPSGTADRTTFATYAGQTISNPPTQAEVQAIDDHLVILSQHVKALIDDLEAASVLP